MPSTKKRITVYLTDEQFALIERAATATGESRAATVVGLVEAAQPMLERVAALAEAMAAAPADVRATFAGAAAQLEQQFSGIVDDSASFFDALEAVVRGETPGGPRLVTRGPES